MSENTNAAAIIDRLTVENDRLRVELARVTSTPGDLADEVANLEALLDEAKEPSVDDDRGGRPVLPLVRRVEMLAGSARHAAIIGERARCLALLEAAMDQACSDGAFIARDRMGRVAERITDGSAAVKVARQALKAATKEGFADGCTAERQGMQERLRGGGRRTAHHHAPAAPAPASERRAMTGTRRFYLTAGGICVYTDRPEQRLDGKVRVACYLTRTGGWHGWLVLAKLTPVAAQNLPPR